jgi:large subunit ribosomal protein L3
VIEGLLGRKLGMVQLFDKEGRMRAATVIEAGPCLVTQLRTIEKDGYQAAQLGYGAKRRLNKPMRGHLKRLGDLRHLREFRVDDPGGHKVGDRVGVEIFQEGDKVDITGTSKGRGFAGGVKRHGFRGGPKTHGQSDRHRAPGAIGAGNTPGRVFKGLRMAGHMGAEQVTARNLEVLQSNAARGLLLVAGAVPGPRNGLLNIRYTKKTLEVARDRKVTVETEAPAAEEEETPPAAEAEHASDAPASEEAPEEAASEAPAAEAPAEEAAAEPEAAPAEGEGEPS